MAAILGAAGLPEEERRALDFADRFESEFVNQKGARRSIDETFAVGWKLLETIPRGDLHRLSEKSWAAHEAEPKG